MRRFAVLAASIFVVLVGVGAAVPAGGLQAAALRVVPESAAPPTDTALPKHGGALAFAGDFSYFPDDLHPIYVANADGTGLTQLTRGSFDARPSWSPDRRQITYYSSTTGDEEGTGEIRYRKIINKVIVMKADGTGKRPVGSGMFPVWSPDGSRIAFIDDTGFTFVNVDGSGRRHVAAGDRSSVAWSPDGRRIAYASSADNWIHIWNLARGASATLGPSQKTVPTSLAWSPDGAKIAFQSDGLELIDTSTGRVTGLTGSGYMPVWSPDGSSIAFTRGKRDEGQLSLFTIRRDGRGERRLASMAAGSWAVSPVVSWSGDGRSLFFDKQRTPGMYSVDIWRINADGTGARPVTRAFPSGASFSAPQWAPTTIPIQTERTPPSIMLRPTRLLKMRAIVDEMSADDRRVAFTDERKGCDGPVAVWDEKSVVTAIPGSTCTEFRYELVLAGTTAAWIEEPNMIPPYYTLVAATLGSKPGGVDGAEEPDDIDNLVGDGELLVYNSSTWKKRGGTWVETNVKLWRVLAGQKELITSGTDALHAVAVDAGRIAVMSPGGRLALLDPEGHALNRPVALGKGVKAVRLTGSLLVVLRGARVEVRDATTGALKHRWPTAPSATATTVEDAQGNFAVYTAGIAIHLLRLTDGRDRVLSITNEAGPAHAQLEPEGLYLSYSVTGDRQTPGRIAFVPFSQIVARFR